MPKIKCVHYWSYVHEIYSNNVIRRYCDKCGLEQHGSVVNWKKTPKNMFDTTAKEAADEINKMTKYYY